MLLLLAIPVVLLTQKQQYDITKLMTQLVLYLALAYNADCLVSGRCKLWAWLMVLLPLIQTIGYLFFVPKLDLQAPIRLPPFRQMEPAKPVLRSSDEKTAGA